MPEKLFTGAILFLSIAPLAEALRISGTTTEGLPFAGSLISAADGELLIEKGRGATTTLLGIPLDSVANITMGQSVKDPLAAVEAFAPLLALWDERTRHLLVKATGELVESGNWTSGYHWTSRLLQLEWVPETEVSLGIYQAWCLFELGLIAACREALLGVEDRIDPMKASTRYCWLKANLAIRNGHREEAKKWICLPALQIPSQQNALTDGMACLLDNPYFLEIDSELP
ncbi:MAG: hypothetical protein AB3N33_01410 [Puniceicoccaceae bacterium]